MSCNNLSWGEDVRYLPSNSQIIPESGGIYKVLRNDGEVGKLSRVYIGKTNSLRSRFLFHISSEEVNTCLKNNIQGKECYFRYALLTGEENRQNAENHLLSLGKYECNTQGQ